MAKQITKLPTIGRGVKVIGAPTKKARSKVSKVTPLPGLKKRIPTLEEMGRQREVRSYAQWVTDRYAKAGFINVLNCSPDTQRQYRRWMDIARKMQFVIDRDAGEGSLQTLRMLYALKVAWPS